MEKHNEMPIDGLDVDRKNKIKFLNDKLRTTFTGGRIVIADGLRMMGEEHVQKIIQRIKLFKSFTLENDPTGEHNRGDMEYNEMKVIWKIDYYGAPRTMPFSAKFRPTLA